MEQPIYLRCSRCGWVHCAMSPEEIRQCPESESLRRCFRCHAPVTELEPCTEADAPRGVTIQGIIWSR